MLFVVVCCCVAVVVGRLVSVVGGGCALFVAVNAVWMCCLLFVVVCGVSFSVCCVLMFVAGCRLSSVVVVVACGSLRVNGRCVLFVVWCLSFAVWRCLMSGVGCCVM